MPKPAGRFFANLQSEFLPPPVSCTLFCPWLPVHVAISEVSEAVPSAASCLTLRPKAAGSLLLAAPLHTKTHLLLLCPCAQSPCRPGQVQFPTMPPQLLLVTCTGQASDMRNTAARTFTCAAAHQVLGGYGAGRSKIQGQPLS